MSCRIGITLGDQAGIGPEIVQAALGSGRLSTDAQYSIIGPKSDCSLGQPTEATARAAFAALEEAARMALDGELDAVVTGPINKARMYRIGFEFPGQTEFFASRCGVDNFAMLLTGSRLTVALVTVHLPLREVPQALRTAEIVRVGSLLHDFLRQRGVATPRIAVAGLNPHAGESGALGREEIEIIEPAVQHLQSEIGNRKSAIFRGPFSPDTIFHHAAEGQWDGVLCMYHDQGLIPLKLHAFHEGVNVTLGLPFPRTSPDHGTAFEIAGKNIARADSMIAAINLAVELALKK
ncbi:MAG TPA: 4-hydroxythreonine-4-phosphate dehydrogenase PdxA [Chthoniobacterales bacterium]|jgi:4-hydroxythreonine-4-phosphate dehydrogenase|nr:4-hydroxythreonine-4-phosphate dehydrogenase PdxA [Chthoniobacterales bacterium]